jgi:hypothetical protein
MEKKRDLYTILVGKPATKRPRETLRPVVDIILK